MSSFSSDKLNDGIEIVGLLDVNGEGISKGSDKNGSDGLGPAGQALVSSQGGAVVNPLPAPSKSSPSLPAENWDYPTTRLSNVMHHVLTILIPNTTSNIFLNIPSQHTLSTHPFRY